MTDSTQTPRLYGVTLLFFGWQAEDAAIDLFAQSLTAAGANVVGWVPSQELADEEDSAAVEFLSPEFFTDEQIDAAEKALYDYASDRDWDTCQEIDPDALSDEEREDLGSND